MLIGAYIALLSGTDLSELDFHQSESRDFMGWVGIVVTLAVFISMGRSNESHSSGAGHLKSIGSIPSDAGTEPAIFGWEGD